MNKNLVMILAIFILPICFYYYLDASQSASANKMNTPMPSVMKFSSNMCSECQSMEKVVKKVYPKYADKIALTNVSVQNSDAEVQELLKKYNVTLVPTFIFRDSSNTIIKRVEGGMSPTEFEDNLKALLND